MNYISNLLVTLAVVAIDLKNFLVSASFIPLFGIYGTDSLAAGGDRNGEFLSRMTFNVWHRIMVVEIVKGKTTFTYTVIGVHPLAYRKLRSDPNAEAFSAEFRKGSNYVMETIWRYSQGGSFRNDGRRARKLG